ncbi:hypothetical protein C9994_12860, partial [Marivirga lumbricoides]
LNLEVVVPKEGYMLIYVSNEEEQANIAYFDDVNVTHKHSAVIQEESYYPFGMSQHYSYQRELTKEQRYTYNGKESISDLDLGWLDYGARMYMPDLGRWFNVDPLAEKYNPVSPYAYVGNMPLIAYDPNGEEIVIVGSGQYMISVLNAILELGRSEEGARMIDHLASSKKRVVIANGTENGEDYGESQDGIETSFVTWNPNITETDNGQRPSYIGLGHELRHSEQNFGGYETEEIIDSNRPFESSDLNALSNTIKNNEIDAVDSENKIRSAMGVGIRRMYGTKDTGMSKDEKTFRSGYNVITGKYTTKNTKTYDGKRNANYTVHWARVVNNFKKGGSPSTYSMKNIYMKDGVDKSYDYRKTKGSAIISW